MQHATSRRQLDLFQQEFTNKWKKDASIQSDPASSASSHFITEVLIELLVPEFTLVPILEKVELQSEAGKDREIINKPDSKYTLKST